MTETKDVELVIAEALLKISEALVELCKNRKLIIEHDYYNKKQL